MRIDSSAKIAGQPSLLIRDLLRKASGVHWGVAYVENFFDVSSRTAKRILRELEREGYIEKTKRFSRRDYWENTIKGNALGLASAARPVSRTRADQKLQEFMKRVQHVNDNEYFLYQINTVIVFGSYLTSKEFINDIDIAIKLVPKVKNQEEFSKLVDRRIDDAFRSGRRFANLLEELAWPQIEVRRYLKSRSRISSIHDTDDGVLKDCELKVIFEAD